ncbi:MAG: hypothetical protein IT178_15450 [Acidobacteria bacterium]|nr:hypothetical protein [Acidobacteriota bacterium]
MQQRQYRPGDVLDDYCPRERRITDHAIVAMVDQDIQRTRCVVCEAEHEFKNARVPAPRRKSSTAALYSQVLDTMEAPPGRIAPPPPSEPVLPAEPIEAAAVAATPPAVLPEPTSPPAPEPSDDVASDRPFRRSLIRAQLPRHEGQVATTRAAPEFTMHQPANPRPKRHGQGQGQGRFRRRPGGGEGGAPRFGQDGQAHGNGNGGGRRRRRKKH